MKVGELKVINWGEQSTMASTWTEYLCIERLTKDDFELSIRSYEVLGEAMDYSDDDGNWDLPDEIGGMKVMGLEDEYVVGGNLVLHSEDYGEVKFSDPQDKEVSDWLKSVGWDNDNTRKEIIKLIKS